MAGGKLRKAQSLEVPKADDFFTDRDEPREILANFFECLYRSKVRGDSGREASLLNFYGVGGVGKSSLLRQAQAEFRAKNRHQTDYSQVQLAHLDLTGLELGKDIPSYELFWKLRNELLHDQLRTTLFDSVYLRIWHADHPGQKMEAPKTKSQDWMELGLDNLVDLTGGTSVLKAARMLWEKAKTRKSFKLIQEILGGKSPEECDRRELVKALPLFLTADIVQAFESNLLLRVALCIDEYEQIQEIQARELSAESCLLELLGELLTDPATRDRFAVVVMGREILRWDRVYDDPEWQPLIESHILSGLSEQDARIFLIDRIAPWLVSNDQLAAAQALIEHQDAILELTRSGPEASRDGCLPLHLDLIVTVARQEAEKFSPELLVNPKGQRERIEERFLRYLKRSDERRLEALQLLAFAPAFDRSLFDYLVSSQLIIGYRPSDFAVVLGGEGEYTDSFIRHHPTWPGYYVFHRQMQTSLVNSTLNASFGTSGVKERLQKMQQFYIDRAQFDTPAEATELHLRMVTLGFDVIRSEAVQQLSSADEASSLIRGLLKSFDSAMAPNLLRPIWAWLAKLLEQQLGPDHLQTLYALGYLASSLSDLGDFEGAKALQEKNLVGRERLLGAEHPDTLSAMGNLALSLSNLGDLEGAKALEEKVLEARERIQGAEHPDALLAMGNLALSLSQLGDLEEAKALQEKVLEARERIQGAEHPDTLLARGSLAYILGELGDFEGEKALQEKVLESRERLLGAEHPDTLLAKGNLAASLSKLGDLEGAKALQEKVLEARERIQGAEHPDTLHAIGNLAYILGELGDFEGAKALQEKVLESRERLLGAEHPDTLVAKGNFAASLSKLGDFEGAKALDEKVLEARERLLGAEHPDTLVARGNLAASLSDLGDFEGAKALQEKVMEARERLLGAEHPHTLLAREKLAGSLSKLGDYEGAKALEEKVLEARERAPKG
jgi:tetratricopeptide (TPR) repeat protein